MARRVKFIYNPSAGEAKIPARLDDIIALYQERGLTIVPYRLDFRGDPAGMLADLDDSYDHILLAGGDGTVNYVVNLLKKHGVDIPLALIPAGTANDFAMLLGTPQGDVTEVCRAILDGEAAEVDIGRVNGEYFVNVFSCGLFTKVSQKTPTLMKNTFGKLAYYVSGLGELTRYRKMAVRIETDGGDYEGKCLLFLVFNGKTAGNLRLSFLSEVDDGLLDLLIITGDRPLERIPTTLRYLMQVQFGNPSSYPAGVAHIRCSRLKAESDTTQTTDIDGQPGPAFPLEITCEKNALKVIRPRCEKRVKKR